MTRAITVAAMHALALTTQDPALRAARFEALADALLVFVQEQHAAAMETQNELLLELELTQARMGDSRRCVELGELLTRLC